MSDDLQYYYIVGTGNLCNSIFLSILAYVLPDESEPSKGRILVFSVNDSKLKLIHEIGF